MITKHKILSVSVLVIILILSVKIAKTCTELHLKAKDGTVVTVRSEEFNIDLKSTLNIQPRGELFTSITTDSYQDNK